MIVSMSAGVTSACAAATHAAAWGHGFRRHGGSARAALRDLVAGIEIEDVLIVAEGENLSYLDANYAEIPLARVMARTRNSLLQQRAHLRIWFARGRRAGVSVGEGHIRWGKVAAGLTGRLGSFTARYIGPACPKGHLIHVEKGDGDLAMGYHALDGTPLCPEVVISNRAGLRQTMADQLRLFAAALPF